MMNGFAGAVNPPLVGRSAQLTIARWGLKNSGPEIKTPSKLDAGKGRVTRATDLELPR